MSNYTAPGTIDHAASISYAKVRELLNTISEDEPVPDTDSPSPDIVITETLLQNTHATEMRVVFKRSGDKYTFVYEAKMLNHINTSKIDNWINGIDAIVKGRAIRFLNTPTYWTGESRLTFLKVACLCNRVDDVQKVFNCSADILNAAYAWAQSHGIKYNRTWLHTDELTVQDCKLTFTLQKWSDGSIIACVNQTIAGKDRYAIEELSGIMQNIIACAKGIQHCQYPKYSDLYARLAIFADVPSLYTLLNTRSSEDLALAQKYESERMIEHLTPRMQEWKIPHMHTATQSYTLVKKDGDVICAELADTIMQVLGNAISVYHISGGPQMWAEIAAFANNTRSLTTVRNIANHLRVPLDDKRIEAAATAGIALLDGITQLVGL